MTDVEFMHAYFLDQWKYYTFGIWNKEFTPFINRRSLHCICLHLLESWLTLTLVYLSRLIEMFVECKTKTFVDIYFISVFTQWMLPLGRPPFSLQHLIILIWVCQVWQVKQWMVILTLNSEMEAVHILCRAI